MVGKKFKTCTTNSRDKLSLINSKKSLIIDLTTILLPKRLILIYCLIAMVMHYQSFYRIEIERLVFNVQFYLGSHFPSRALTAHQGRKVNHVKEQV